MTSQPGFVERVEARLSEIDATGEIGSIAGELMRQALTEILAESKPVYQHLCIGLGAVESWADVDEAHYKSAHPSVRRVLFTHPAPSALAEAQGRIEALLARNAFLSRDVEKLTAQLDAAQAAMKAIKRTLVIANNAELLADTIWMPRDVSLSMTLFDYIDEATDQPAKGSGQ
jgi:hypothetical protein